MFATRSPVRRWPASKVRLWERWYEGNGNGMRAAQIKDADTNGIAVFDLLRIARTTM